MDEDAEFFVTAEDSTEMQDVGEKKFEVALAFYKGLCRLLKSVHHCFFSHGIFLLENPSTKKAFIRNAIPNKKNVRMVSPASLPSSFFVR